MNQQSYQKWVSLISAAQSIWDIANIQKKLAVYGSSTELTTLKTLLEAKKQTVSKDATVGIATKNPSKTTRPGF